MLFTNMGRSLLQASIINNIILSSTRSQIGILQTKIVAEDKVVEHKTAELLMEWEKGKPVQVNLPLRRLIRTSAKSLVCVPCAVEPLYCGHHWAKKMSIFQRLICTQIND